MANDNTKKTRLFIEKAIHKHGARYDYGLVNYQTCSANILIICPTHGSFLQTPSNHLKGRGCSRCANIRNKVPFEEFLERARAAHGIRYDYSQTNYNGINSKISIICDRHGIFMQLADEHCRYDCNKCARELVAAKETSNSKDFIEKAVSIHGDTYNYESVHYQKIRIPVKIKCPIHGFFNQMPGTHLSGSDCPNCARKNMGKLEQLWLDMLKVPTEFRQKRMKVGGRSYIFDAFVPDANIVYEFDGDYWHGNPRFYDPMDLNPSNKTSFGELYQATERKRLAVKKAGLALVSIWESDFCRFIIDSELQLSKLYHNSVRSRYLALQKLLRYE